MMMTMVHDFVAMVVQGAVAHGSNASSISTLGAACVFIWIAIAVLSTHVPRRFFVQQEQQDFQRDGKFTLRHNLDWAPQRRKLFSEFDKVRKALDPATFSSTCEGVIIEEEYKVISRGVEIFTKSWLPEGGKAKGIVCYCHGYGDTVTFFFEGIARKLAKEKYAVFGMDYEGFGLSSGLHGYIENFDNLVDDVIEHYSSVKERDGFEGLPCFLFGESMGGAVALKAHLKQPNAWDGAVLVAPMCKIADDMYPPWVMVQILKALVPIFPKSKIIPSRDLAAYAFRDPEKRKKAMYNVIGYGDRPRLRTAWELLLTTADIEARMDKVSLPLLILHGAADKVTDPSVSKALYDKASSSDKTLHLYEGVWHAILEGECDEMTNKVLDDIVSWMNSHSHLHL